MLKYILVAALALPLVAVASEASAQSKISPKREAAIRLCTERVAALWGTSGAIQQNTRAAAFKDCMVQQGQRP
jgi:hypothetical protein